MLIFSIKQCSYFASNTAHILYQTMLIFCIKQCSYFASKNAHRFSTSKKFRKPQRQHRNFVNFENYCFYYIFFYFVLFLSNLFDRVNKPFLIKINNLCFVLFIKSFAFFVSKHTNFFKIKAFQIF